MRTRAGHGAERECAAACSLLQVHHCCCASHLLQRRRQTLALRRGLAPGCVCLGCRVTSMTATVRSAQGAAVSHVPRMPAVLSGECAPAAVRRPVERTATRATAQPGQRSAAAAVQAQRVCARNSQCSARVCCWTLLQVRCCCCCAAQVPQRAPARARLTPIHAQGSFMCAVAPRFLRRLTALCIACSSC